MIYFSIVVRPRWDTAAKIPEDELHRVLHRVAGGGVHVIANGRIGRNGDHQIGRNEDPVPLADLDSAIDGPAVALGDTLASWSAFGAGRPAALPDRGGCRPAGRSSCGGSCYSPSSVVAREWISASAGSLWMLGLLRDLMLAENSESDMGSALRLNRRLTE